MNLFPSTLSIEMKKLWSSRKWKCLDLLYGSINQTGTRSTFEDSIRSNQLFFFVELEYFAAEFLALEIWNCP